jgi:hypothetical protein
MKKKNSKWMALAVLCIVYSQVKAQDTQEYHDPEEPQWTESPTPACQPNSPAWVIGGNILNNAQNTIGTCNYVPFVLKSNNKPGIFLKPNSFVGIGMNNSAPTAALDIKNTDPNNPVNESRFRIYADKDGNVESSVHINVNFAAGNAFRINEGTAASNVNRVTVENGGNMVVGGLYPSSAKLDVQDQNNCKIHVLTDSPNNAGVWLMNTVASYGMETDGSGIGHISSNEPSPLHLMNFTWNATTAKPSVWVGSQKPVAPHDDFAFAVAGKLVAQSIYVTNVNNWADYVFASDYELPKLNDVEAFYKINKHLPEIPTASEVEEKGIDVAEMNKLLLKKVEELTIYLVEQQKQMDALKEEVRSKK